jgi:hypothetical protein
MRYTNIKTKDLYTFPLTYNTLTVHFVVRCNFFVHLCHTLPTKFYFNLGGTEFGENGIKETPAFSVAYRQVSNTAFHNVLRGYKHL